MAAAAREEHILLESADAEVEASAHGALRARITFDNPLLRARTELRLYDNGFLGVRELRAAEDSGEYRLALRHLDPRPRLSRRVRSSARNATLCALALAVCLAVIGYFATAQAIALPATAGALLAATLAAVSYVYRVEERLVLVTRHGGVPVLTLVAGWGCIRSCRALVPRLASEIQAAQRRDDQDANALLRAEVREHYRLREAGILSADECIVGVRRILTLFG